MTQDNAGDQIIFRNPTVSDGAGMWTLVKETGALDPNSAYMYLLLAKDFSDTCIVAEKDGKIIGFVSGYRPPARPDSVFLWQVGVHPSMHGQGLGKRLVAAFLNSRGAKDATLLEATIAPSNRASQSLFKAIARDIDADLRITEGFTEDHFPGTGHEAEELYLIGPLDPVRTSQLKA